MRPLTLMVIAMTTGACSHSGPHAHGHHAGAHEPGRHGGAQEHGHHGNPADLEAYVARLESPERAAWQQPDAVVRALALAPGAVACDVGAGSGYFATRLAAAVGAGGLVYAVDVEPRILSVLRDRLAKSTARNVIPVLALADDPLLPDASCDLVLIVNTLHHFPEPAAYLERLRRALKPAGRLVNIDFHARETPVGPPLAMRVAREAFLELAAKAGLQVVSEHDLLPHQYFVELRAK